MGWNNARRRAEFVKGQGRTIARQIDSAATGWATSTPLSKIFGWCSTTDRLVVVGCPEERQRDLDRGLAFGLGHARDRELVLVLLAGMAEATRRRLPWISVPVRLYGYGPDGEPAEVMPLAPNQVLATHTDEVVVHVHALDVERSAWVKSLIDRATSQGFDAAHRSSYLAWRRQGRMVLRIRRATDGLLVTAGVHHQDQTKAAHAVTLRAPLTAAELVSLQAAATKAANDKMSGLDIANAEHWFQDVIAKHCGSIGLTHLAREFPAFRLVRRRGYVDFLGIGEDGNLHVVETMIGADPMLALQGLDYWTWATAHRTQLVSHFIDEHGANASENAEVMIDFVVASKAGRAVSPYTMAQVEAFDGSIGWRFHTVESWESGTRSSQAFALNLFGGLDPAALGKLWACIDPEVAEHTSIEFEYSDPTDALGEAQPSRPHRTQVDVLLRGRTATGGRRVALTEVKLSEVGFGSCSAFSLTANCHLACCASSGPWGGDTEECFQLQNHGASTPRRYDQFLPPAWVAPSTSSGCPFRALNQPMRNVALARALIDREEAEAATLCLCAPTGNTNVWRQWSEARRVLATVPDVEFSDLPAHEVAALHGLPDQAILRSRHDLTATSDR